MSTAATLRQQVSDLTSTISHQRRLLEDWETQLKDLQKQLDSISYPVLTLPPEITSEIFVHCLPVKRDHDVVNVDEAPLLLTRVCSVWRKIAISTPALWTTFQVKLDGSDDLPELSKIAQSWFKRSKSCPVSVKISGPVADNASFSRFVKILTKQAPKICSLELRTGADDYEAIESKISGAVDLSILQALSIRLSDPDDSIDAEAIAMFQNAPLLQDVCISDVPDPASYLLLPWQQLTTFTGELFSVPACWEVMRLMPNLINCSLSVFTEGHTADAFESISLLNLQHLTLFESTDIDAPASTDIIEFLATPALQTLEVNGVEDFDSTVFVSFLKRSSPPLQKLVLRAREFDPLLLFTSPAFFNLVLSELEIWKPSSDFVIILCQLLGKSRSGTTLPQLRKLSFLSCPRFSENEEDAEMDEILRIAAEPITQRMEMVAGCVQLQSFRLVEEKVKGIYYLTRYSEDAIAPFRALKLSGKDIYVGTEEISTFDFELKYPRPVIKYPRPNYRS